MSGRARAMVRTNENYLNWQLGRWARSHAPNVTSLPAEEWDDVELASDEHRIARIASTMGEPPLLVTDQRLLQAGSTLLWYRDVRWCDWIDPDRRRAAELKATRYQRLIFTMSDGRKLTVDGLGQAVFPLLKFFWFKLGSERSRD
jgi:hypothetical protein